MRGNGVRFMIFLLRLRLFHVSDFPENTYFPEMLFSGKENNFKCLVIFQKILWKIFSGVWLNGWKCYFPTTTKIKITQKTHFLTFSPLPNKYIISSLNSETQIKPRKKKNHNPVKRTEEGREGGRSVLGCDDRDRGRRIGAATAIAIGAKAKSNGEVVGWSRTATSNGEVEGCDSKSNGEVEVEQLCALGSISFWVRSLWPELGWPEGCALSLSLSLCCCAFWALSAFFLSLSLCIAWPGNELKWKWKCKFISGSKA